MPYFTIIIRFSTKEIPFYVHDRFEPAGFSAEDQGGRFDVLILSTKSFVVGECICPSGTHS